ncbi:ferric reductase-like transmembrane domain-containing protein [Candidatus Pacearchaeota archaeon]|nr:ferric reductase-like transmembrane domain-containing protein [Candidatus Pacearchaeota archaeon]
MGFSIKKGYIFAFILALLPVIYILIFMNDAVLFSNFSSSMRSLGKILGLVGIILFSLTFLLNTRLKFTEKLFNGLDNTYKAHHILGTISFLLLLFHPLFLASQYITSSFAAVAKFLYPLNENISVTFGNLGLFLMEIFLILTFIGKLNYKTWKFTHRFLGVAFIFASLHVLLISSDVSRNWILRGYITMFLLIGLMSYGYRSIFRKYFVKVYNYEVKFVKTLGNITEIKLTPKNNFLNFVPGQFVFISFDSAIGKESHPFTISSSSSDRELGFSIKNLGDFTGKLKDLKEGSIAKIEGPFGRFSFVNYPSKNYIFIAGGIGITPFLSMIRSIEDNPDKYYFESIDLHYSIKTEKEAVFLDELNEISKKFSEKKLNIFLHITEKSGYLNLQKILEKSKNLYDSKIFICGPVNMMHSLKEQLIYSGIKKDNIKIEEFALL